MRQAKSLSPTSGFPWSDESLQVVASPCCEMALPDVISAILAQALGPPTPRSPSDAFTRFFSEGVGLPHGGRGSALRTFPATASAGRAISGLQSFSNVRAPVLARPPDCSHRIHGPSIVRSTRALDGMRSLAWRQLWHAPSCRFSMNGQPGRLHHAVLGWLPAPSSGIATCLNRAIDMTGLSPVGSQPCRLLRPRPPAGRRPRTGGRQLLPAWSLVTESAAAGGRGRPGTDPAETAAAGELRRERCTRRRRGWCGPRSRRTGWSRSPGSPDRSAS